MSGDLPERHIVWRLAQDTVQPGLFFAATEFGMFTSVDGGRKWVKLGGAPTIAFRDVVIQERENDLVCASFGRGLFVLDDYTPLRTISEESLEQPALLFAPRTAPWFRPRPPGGLGAARFPGHGLLHRAQPSPRGGVHLLPGRGTEDHPAAAPGGRDRAGRRRQGHPLAGLGGPAARGCGGRPGRAADGARRRRSGGAHAERAGDAGRAPGGLGPVLSQRSGRDRRPARQGAERFAGPSGPVHGGAGPAWGRGDHPPGRAPGSLGWNSCALRP